MIFPTALILGLLSITPAFTAPVYTSSDALVERDEPQSLEARGELYGLDFDMMEKRDIASQDQFEQLVARSPEPEMEDVEARGIFGFAKMAVKGIVKGAKAAHKVHQAHQHRKNRHHKRSKIGRKFKNFFKKVGKGLGKAVKFASSVLRRNDESAVLEARSFDEPELELRSFDEPELEVRSLDEPEIEARSLEEPELEARSFDEPEFELEARSFDEPEFELKARSFDEPEFELEARSFDEPELELEARSFDEPELEVRAFEEEEF